jgi:hypothetical protein
MRAALIFDVERLMLLSLPGLGGRGRNERGRGKRKKRRGL